METESEKLSCAAYWIAVNAKRRNGELGKPEFKSSVSEISVWNYRYYRYNLHTIFSCLKHATK